MIVYILRFVFVFVLCLTQNDTVESVVMIWSNKPRGFSVNFDVELNLMFALIVEVLSLHNSGQILINYNN